MAFNIIISPKAQEHVDQIVEYVLYRLMNPTAAVAFLDDIEHSYHVLAESATAFGLCNDPYLAAKGYHKIPLDHYDYVILYRIQESDVLISGVFHMLEDYRKKL